MIGILNLRHGVGGQLARPVPLIRVSAAIEHQSQRALWRLGCAFRRVERLCRANIWHSPFASRTRTRADCGRRRSDWATSNLCRGLRCACRLGGLGGSTSLAHLCDPRGCLHPRYRRRLEPCGRCGGFLSEKAIHLHAHRLIPSTLAQIVDVGACCIVEILGRDVVILQVTLEVVTLGLETRSARLKASAQPVRNA